MLVAYHCNIMNWRCTLKRHKNTYTPTAYTVSISSCWFGLHIIAFLCTVLAMAIPIWQISSLLSSFFLLKPLLLSFLLMSTRGGSDEIVMWWSLWYSHSVGCAQNSPRTASWERSKWSLFQMSLSWVSWPPFLPFSKAAKLNATTDCHLAVTTLLFIISPWSAAFAMQVKWDVVSVTVYGNIVTPINGALCRVNLCSKSSVNAKAVSQPFRKLVCYGKRCVLLWDWCTWQLHKHAVILPPLLRLLNIWNFGKMNYLLCPPYAPPCLGFLPSKM